MKTILSVFGWLALGSLWLFAAGWVLIKLEEVLRGELPSRYKKKEGNQ